MKRNTKFKVGDLIIFPQRSHLDPKNDYGIVIDIVLDNSDLDYYYHIHWAVERVKTVEDWDYAEKNFLLVRRA
jgi:hypothetical protein